MSQTNNRRGVTKLVRKELREKQIVKSTVFIYMYNQRFEQKKLRIEKRGKNLIGEITTEGITKKGGNWDCF